MRRGWLEREGVRLHYVEWPSEEAEEPSLLLLHGLSSNALFWTRLAGHLPHRRLVALDQRSHGRSDRPPAGYSFEALAADAAHAITELGLRRPVLVGHSWGASVALALAAGRPKLVSGLAFLDGPGASMSAVMSWDQAASLMQPPLPHFAKLEEAHADVRSHLGDAWDDDLRGFAEARATAAAGGGWELTLTAPVRLEILAGLYNNRPELLWPLLEVPVLLGVARSAGALLEWKERTANLVRELVADLQVRWYESDHDIPLIRPVELARDLERLCLRAAWSCLGDEARALDGDWEEPSGVGGWSARQLLAHLASTQADLVALLRSRAHPDGRNEPPLGARAGAAPEQLVAELAQGTVAIREALLELDIDAPVGTGTHAGQPVGDALRALLAYQRGHLEQLRTALKAPGWDGV